jgi:hypothetical protein
VYRTTVNEENPHVVLANGARLFPYDDNDDELQDDLDSLQTLARGNTPGFRADGTALYVHLAGGADPNNATMIVSRYNHAFYVEQDFIYFVNLTFRYYGQASWAKAIYFNNASDNLVQGDAPLHLTIWVLASSASPTATSSRTTSSTTLSLTGLGHMSRMWVVWRTGVLVSTIRLMGVVTSSGVILFTMISMALALVRRVRIR